MVGFLCFVVVAVLGWVAVGYFCGGFKKPVTAGIYMYCAPWEADENRYHPTRRDRTNTLVSRTFWTVAAARAWAEATHLKYLAGEPPLQPTVTTVAFVQYGDWEDLFPAAPYWAFPQDYGTNESVWKDEEHPYATAWSL